MTRSPHDIPLYGQSQQWREVDRSVDCVGSDIAGACLLKVAAWLLAICHETVLMGKCVRLQSSDNGAVGLPSGELVYTAPSGMQTFATSLRLIRALPWRRFKKGSVLVIEVSCRVHALWIALVAWLHRSVDCLPWSLLRSL